MVCCPGKVDENVQHLIDGPCRCRGRGERGCLVSRRSCLTKDSVNLYFSTPCQRPGKTARKAPEVQNQTCNHKFTASTSCSSGQVRSRCGAVGEMRGTPQHTFDLGRPGASPGCIFGAREDLGELASARQTPSHHIGSWGHEVSGAAASLCCETRLFAGGLRSKMMLSELYPHGGCLGKTGKCPLQREILGRL
jgi:hypothetical protein